jgi:hypothetical protein
VKTDARHGIFTRSTEVNGVRGQQTINTVEEKHQFIADFDRNLIDLEAKMLCRIDKIVPKS